MAPLQPPSLSSTATLRSRSLLKRRHLHEGGGGGGGGGGGMRGGHHSSERSSSFNGRSSTATSTATTTICRPKTRPDLLLAAAGIDGRKMMHHVSSPHPDDSGRRCDHRHHHNHMESERRVPTKILVKVNVQRVLGALHVIASTEWSVEDLVAASLNHYIKECRQPLLPSTDPSAFTIHYSQFYLQCLDPKEKLIGLGSRSFFLRPKSTNSSSTANELLPTSSPSSCSDEANRATKITLPWLRFMGFLF